MSAGSSPYDVPLPSVTSILCLYSFTGDDELLRAEAQEAHTQKHMKKTEDHIQRPSFWQQVVGRVTKSERFYHLVHKRFASVSENNLLYDAFIYQV